MTKAYLQDLLERVASTFVVAAAGSLAFAWAGSGLDAEHLTDWSAWQKVISAAIVAGLAAVGSLIKGLIAGAKTGTGSLSTVVAETAVVPPPAA